METKSIEIESLPPKEIMRDLDLFQYVDFKSLTLAEKIYSRSLRLLRQHVFPILVFGNEFNLSYISEGNIHFSLSFFRDVQPNQNLSYLENINFLIDNGLREIILTRESISSLSRLGFGLELRYAQFFENGSQTRVIDFDNLRAQKREYDKNKLF